MDEVEKQFNLYAKICERTMLHIMMSIEDYLEEMKLPDKPRCPIVAVESRIKTFSSVQEKCERKGYPCTIDSIKHNIRDIAGIRIITLFKDDIYTVAQVLKTRLRLNVVVKKDYVEYPKSNGYQSLHLMAQREFYFNDETHMVPVEIQIRTKTMDVWASLEHILKYKNDEPNPDTEKQLKEVANNLIAFDRSVINLRGSETLT